LQKKSATSFAVLGLFAAFFSSMRNTKRSTSGLTESTLGKGSGFLLTWETATSTGVLPENGLVPTIISYVITPSE
jgi:hypothetical protein